MTSNQTTSRASAVSAERPGKNAKARFRPFRLVSEVLMAGVVLLFLFPIVFTFFSAFKSNGEIFAQPPSLFGAEFRWQNFVEVFEYTPFLRFIFNGLVVSIIGTVIVVAVSALAAYSFGILRWRGRDKFMLLYLATMMIPQEVLVIPMFLLMQKLGWINTWQALILPWAFGAFGAFLLRQFFVNIPYELVEASRMDGCSQWRTFSRIILPLAKPSLAVLAVWTFITFWNSFLWPLIVVNDVNELGNVSLGLQTFFGEHGSSWNLVMAASVIAILPTLLLVVALQKHLVKGIATVGLAGR
ncbi:UNVERIFIED_ORG: multiple sugar transport system permease protein [Paenarthrobacter nicotinovorans]|uniref:carbohydrate ABC transporter permease n=1 Tax=Paenarthrobacter histidinolovorans TaxID=43664 RepID=UPI001665A829|nr:carbohydrate ABC transporter permease [Paenarthrobacter histidinolovorans]GGJ28418.1 ABC transporter permease [Paenarthrobacter histidinolovorans]